MRYKFNQTILILRLLSTYKGQTGTSWLPSPNSTSPEQNLDRVDTLVILFSIQIAINILGALDAHGALRLKFLEQERNDSRWDLL